MKLNRSFKTSSQLVDHKMAFLKKSFMVAAVCFLAICLVGYITSISVDSSGIIKKSLTTNGQFDVSFYSKFSNYGTHAKIAKLSFWGIALILISSFLNIVWTFIMLKASKLFIYSTLFLYIAGQGIGFGILFLTWNARDLLIVFGIAGAIFLFMAAIGFLSKNLLPLGRWLFYGFIASLFITFVIVILYFTKMISGQHKIMIVLWGLMGFLVIGWIAFDIWLVKRTAEYAQAINGFDKEIEFRLTMWFGFRLLSDFISLLWFLARSMGKR